MNKTFILKDGRAVHFVSSEEFISSYSDSFKSPFDLELHLEGTDVIINTAADVALMLRNNSSLTREEIFWELADIKFCTAYLDKKIAYLPYSFLRIANHVCNVLM